MSEKSLLKTPEEIKKGLKCCIMDIGCEECPYDGDPAPVCYDEGRRDALTYIKQLESDNESKQKRIEELESLLAQANLERASAVNDLEKAISMSGIHNLDCEFCEDRDKPTCSFCYWIWRGVCPENTKEIDSNAHS